MKILHVAETVRGGIASHLQEILGTQARRFGAGNVAVIVPEDQCGELDGFAAMLRPFTPGTNRAASTMRLARETADQIKGFRPDIIHAHSTFAGIAVRSLPRRLLGRCRTVYCPHGWSFAMNDGAVRRRAYSLIERLLSRRCERIINVSAHERDLALAYGLPADRLEVVVNGISADTILAPMARASAAGPLRLLFVGRPARQKGLDILLEAIASLDAGHVRLEIVGATAADIGATAMAAGNIAAHGWVPRARAQAIMTDCDALVMPSRWEGLPIAALEAMRAGKAVIASDCCSFGEIVEHGVTGLLFETGNPTALSAALRGLERANLERMGRAGRARFLEHFTIDAQESRIADIYREIASPSNLADA